VPVQTGRGARCLPHGVAPADHPTPPDAAPCTGRTSPALNP